MEAWRNSTETQQSGHAPRSGPVVKNGRICAKDGAGEAQMRDNPGGGELNSAEVVHRRLQKKICLPFYPA